MHTLPHSDTSDHVCTRSIYCLNSASSSYDTDHSSSYDTDHNVLDQNKHLVNGTRLAMIWYGHFERAGGRGRGNGGFTIQQVVL